MVVAAITIPILIFGLILLAGIYALGGFRDNVAHDAVSPLTASLVGVGGRLLCDQGDAGYGPDNRQPWYQATYSVPRQATARLRFFNAAGQDGYRLVPDVSVPHQTAERQYFTSDPNDPQLGGLGLVIERGSKSSQPCGAGGPQASGAPAGGAIYEISFTSPSR